MRKSIVLHLQKHYCVFVSIVLLVLFTPSQTYVDGKQASTWWWQPKASENITWQIQYSGPRIITSYDVDMYNVDLFDVTQDVIDKLHAENRTVVCYFSAGSYEDWRSDWSKFFKFVKRNKFYNGNRKPFAGVMKDWDGERWLDIRRIDLLSGIMKQRLKLAKDKKCDAVDPDNMNVWERSNKKEAKLLDITGEDQLIYNKWIAAEAHKLNLSIGLKNDADQLEDLVHDFDWALNEECVEYSACGKYNTFIQENKAVFGIEYTGDICKICKEGKTNGMFLLKKNYSLGSWRQACDDESVKKICSF